LNRLLTLAIATVASVVAAIVTSEVFDGSVLGTAAITPVIVALVTELLTAAAPGRKQAEPAPAEPTATRPTAAQPPPRRRRLGFGAVVAAILIGLTAFLIAVVVLTVPEVVADKSITGQNGQTTFFGDNANKPWGEARSWSDCFDDIEQCVRDILESNQ
jgi:hypothetical protein